MVGRIVAQMAFAWRPGSGSGSTGVRTLLPSARHLES